MNSHNINSATEGLLQIYKINKRAVLNLLKKFFKYYKLDKSIISINFTTDKEIIFLHKKYFSKNKTTDVITLDWSEGKNIEGEIFINLVQAKRQAIIYKQTIQKEIARLVIHGLLHLLGYDDVTIKKQKTMISKQEFLISKFLK